MKPRTKSYSFNAPAAIWDAWVETVPRRQNLDDALVELLAEQALDERRGLSDEARQEIARVLDIEEGEL